MATGNDPTTIPSYEVLEGTTPQLTAVLKDENGDPVDVADIDAATLTLFVPESGTIVNSRNKQDIKNTNNVTIDASGNLTWDIQPDDLEIIDTSDAENNREIHRALFEYEFDGNARFGAKQVDLVVHNLQKVP